MDIYQYLRKDHQKVSQMLDKLLEQETGNHPSSAEAEMILAHIIEEVLLHSKAEDEVFYSRIKSHSEHIPTLNHAAKEHLEIQNALMAVMMSSPKTEDRKQALNDFKKALDHHVKFEEDTIFKCAKEVFSAQIAKDLVSEMEAAKKRFAPQSKQEDLAKIKSA